MTEANFRTFQHHKSQKITTYSSIVYGLLTRTQQQTGIDIKLPEPITDANTVLRNYVSLKFIMTKILYVLVIIFSIFRLKCTH